MTGSGQCRLALVAVVLMTLACGAGAARGAGGPVARPVPYGAPLQPPLCSAHFCIHWVDSGVDAPPLADANSAGVPGWVRQVDRVLEFAYRRETGRPPDGLGWRAPPGDGSVGGSWNKVDVYLKDLGGHGVAGFTALDIGQTGVSRTSYLVFDNDFSSAQYGGRSPVLSLELTAAHELNHVLQFGYDALEDPWMLEATAVWTEDQVFPGLHGLEAYLNDWSRLPQRPITLYDPWTGSPGNVKVYGSGIWNEWLESRYGPAVIRDAFRLSPSTDPANFAPAAYDAAIRAHGGPGFGPEFARFAAATAEWRARSEGFRTAGTLPDIRRSGTLRLGGTVAPTVDDTAYSLWTVPVGVWSGTVTGRLPTGIAGALAVVVRRGGPVNGSVVVRIHPLPRGGEAAIRFRRPEGVARVTAVIVNADVATTGRAQATGAWIFTGDGQMARLGLRSLR